MRTKMILSSAALGVGLLAGSIGVASILPTGAASATSPAKSVTSQPAPTKDGKPGKGAGLRFFRTHPGLRRLRRHEFVVAAQTIGVPPEQLRTDVLGGQSIADVAAAHHVAATTVVDTVVKDATTKINQAVADHRLTQARATTIESHLEARVTKAVDFHRTN